MESRSYSTPKTLLNFLTSLRAANRPLKLCSLAPEARTATRAVEEALALPLQPATEGAKTLELVPLKVAAAAAMAAIGRHSRRTQDKLSVALRRALAHDDEMASKQLRCVAAATGGVIRGEIESWRFVGSARVAEPVDMDCKCDVR